MYCLWPPHYYMLGRHVCVLFVATTLLQIEYSYTNNSLYCIPFAIIIWLLQCTRGGEKTY